MSDQEFTVTGPIEFDGVEPGESGTVDSDKYNLEAAVEAGLIELKAPADPPAPVNLIPTTTTETPDGNTASTD